MFRPAEQMLAMLRSAGFRGGDAVRIVGAVAAYVSGSLLREIGGAAGLEAQVDSDECRRPQLKPAEFPQITSLPAEHALADPDADFELGLDLLLLGMDALLAIRSGGEGVPDAGTDHPGTRRDRQRQDEGQHQRPPQAGHGGKAADNGRAGEQARVT
jgi:hypothetical protein